MHIRLIDVKKINKSIRKILHNGESVFLYAEQSKRLPGGAVSLPDSLYITNSRIIFRSPKLMGFKSDVESIYYQDIINARLKRGYLSSEIIVKTKRFKDELILPAVNKKLAEKALDMIIKGTARTKSKELLNKEGKRKETVATQISSTVSHSAISIPNITSKSRSPILEIDGSAIQKDPSSIKMKEVEVNRAHILELQQPHTEDNRKDESKSSSPIGVKYQSYRPDNRKDESKSSSPIGVNYSTSNAIMGATHLASSAIRTAAAIDLMSYQTRDNNLAYAEESNNEAYVEEAYVEESNNEAYVEEAYVEESSFDFSFDF